MITQEDLKWWLDLAPTLAWTFARTYAQSAPHEYIVSSRTKGMTPEDYVRAARVIRTFGEPAKFYNSTNIYLTSPDGWKWWGMDAEVAQTDLINRAPALHIYGPQNAPRTRSGVESAYDEIATEWDAEHAATAPERAALVQLVRDLVGDHPRGVLDVGCGTGLALDLELTTPDRYVGIDPSQAMLNQLVLKHPYLAGIHPLPFALARERRVLGGSKFELVLALGGAASYLEPTDIMALQSLASGPVILTHFADGNAPATEDLPPEALVASRDAARDLAAAHGGYQLQVGRFIVTSSILRV